MGSDIQPGLYVGQAGTGLLGSCYWVRLRNVSGDFEDILANDNAVGQFYIEVLPTDGYLKTDCKIYPFAPGSSNPASSVGPGTYLIEHDISAGTYSGKASTEILDSCYWAKLSGLSGEFSDLIANDNATGQFYVQVSPSDRALSTTCHLELATPTIDPAPTPIPSTAPQGDPATTPSPPPAQGNSIAPGTYSVGSDIQPGLYVGQAGTDLLGSCYWARLRNVSGDFEDILANDNAVGQFYIEVLPTDGYLETDCRIYPFTALPGPSTPASSVGPGTYLVGQDISAGTYSGKASTDILDSCYWARLSGLSGDFSDLIANDNATGQFYVQVSPSDRALSTACHLELVQR